MSTVTTETVTVPKDVLGPVLTAYLHSYGRDKTSLEPEAAAAIRTVFNSANTTAADGDDNTVRLDAETAWTLAFHCDAMHIYRLDEGTDEAWEHPAVLALQALGHLVDEQAPDTAARCEAAVRAELDALRVADTH